MSQPTFAPIGLPRRGEIFDGKYRIDRVLGFGGMGAVFAATHLGLDELVAIKVLRPEYVREPGAAERFMGEGRASSKIRSEHVARVMDVGLFEGRPYLVLEHLDGTDLGAMLKELGPLRIPSAIDFVLQACEAIAEAHARGVVHRDLKPTNLFLTHRADGSACVKVLDFGIAEVRPLPGRAPAHAVVTSADVVGSPHYMPPEQLAGGAVDARSDIWSIGAMLQELITGRPPFEGAGPPDLSVRIQRDPPARLSQGCPEVPPALEAVILRCLEKNPSDRFSNIAELAQALASFGGDSARASARVIARILEGGIDAGGAAIFANDRTSRSSRPDASLSRSSVPSPPMRSAVPGYLVAATVLLAMGSTAGWVVGRQLQAVRDAEARSSASVLARASQSALPPPPPTLPAFPVSPEPTATPAPVVTTTGATVTREGETFDAGAAVTLAAEHPATAPSPRRHRRVRPPAPRAEPAAAASSVSDDNPYAPGIGTTPAPTAAPAPAPDHLFDIRK